MWQIDAQFLWLVTVDMVHLNFQEIADPDYQLFNLRLKHPRIVYSEKEAKKLITEMSKLENEGYFEGNFKAVCTNC